MSRGLVRLALIGPGVFVLAVMLSCGQDQKLVAIDITPQNFTFLAPGTQVQFTAFGEYVHPPEKREITSQVVWASSAPNIIKFQQGDPIGTATSQPHSCATNLGLTASVYSNPKNPSAGSVVVGTTTVSADDKGDPAAPACM